MALLSSTVGLLYQVKGDVSHAEKELEKLDKKADDVSKGGVSSLSDGLDALSETVAGIAVPVGIAAAGLTAIGAAALNATKFLFDLAGQTASTASEIEKFQKLTNLSVGSVQSLKIAAESVGDSLETITEIWESFSELIIDAARGNQDAITKLTQNGINAKTAVQDLEGTFKQALKVINDAPAGFRQNAAAMALMGESGLDIIPILKTFNGDLDALTKRLSEQGVIMDADGIKKAREFGKAYGELSKQVEGLVNIFALQYMPKMTDSLRSVSKAFAENKNSIQVWGEIAGSALNGFILIGKYTFGVAKEVVGGLSELIRISTFGLIDLMQNVDAIYNRYEQRVAATNKQKAEKEAAENASKAAFLSAGGKLTDDKPWTPENATQKLQKELQLAQEYNELEIAAEKQKFETLDRINQEALENKRITTGQYILQTLEALRDLQANVANLMTDSFNLAVKGKSGQELDNLRKKYDNDLKAWWDGIEAQKSALLKRQTDEEKKDVEQKIKLAQTEAERRIEIEKSRAETDLATKDDLFRRGIINENEYAQAVARIKLNSLEFEKKTLQEQLSGFDKRSDQYAETTQKIALLDQELARQQIENARAVEEAINNATIARDRFLNTGESGTFTGTEGNSTPGENTDGGDAGTGTQGGGIFGGIFAGLGEASDLLTDFGDVWQTVGGTIHQAISSMAQGIGNLVQNMVLLGNAGGASIQKLVASVLAGVSAQAATLAVMELAYGIAALTPWGAAIYGPAPFHFKAAALFGSIALGAGLLGRAVAGNSFNQQAQAATGGGASSGGGRSGNGGQVYSSYGHDASVINIARNAPA